MDISSQQSNIALLQPAVSLQRYQQQSQNGVVDNTTSSSPTSEGVATQAKRESVDQVRLSPAARQAYDVSNDDKRSTEMVVDQPSVANDSDQTTEEAVAPSGAISAYQKQARAGEEVAERGEGESISSQPDSFRLSPEAQQKVLELSQRDQEVQVHEAAHAAVGGQYAGAPSLSYETGPDGKRYAVSGEVNIDISEVAGDPAATMKKADVIRAAALAPAQPSSQDRNVAARASQMRVKAQAELMAESTQAASQIVERSISDGSSSAVADKTIFSGASVRFSGAVA